MNCKHVEKYVEDYLADQLDPVLKRMIQDHLATCEHCLRVVDKAKSVSDFLQQGDKNLDLPSISSDLMNRVRDIDHEDVSDEDELLHPRISGRSRWLILLTVVAGIIGIGLLVIPFESKLDQQHVGVTGGPGFTWIGDFPGCEPDPFDLNGMDIPDVNLMEPEDDTEGQRVIHTLDFGEPSGQMDDSEHREEGR